MSGIVRFLFRRQNIWILGVLAVVLAVYWQALSFGFVWDDLDFISGWEVTHRFPESLSELVMGSLPEGYVSSYRPLRSVFYGFGYWLWQEEASFYHLQAVGVHLAGVGVVYLIAIEFFRQRVAAAASALWFGLHAAAVEAVAWVTASFDTIGNVFLLGGVWCYLRYRAKSGGGEEWRKLALVFGTMAGYVNELALSWPVWVFLYELVMIEGKLKEWRRALNRAVPFGLVFLPWGIGKLMVGENAPEMVHLYSGIWGRLAVFLQTFVVNTKIVVVPESTRIIHEVFDGVSAYFVHDISGGVVGLPSTREVLVAFLVVAGGLVLGYLLRKKKFGVFLMGWYLVALLPVSQIVALDTLVADRYLYLALVPWAVGLGLVVKWALSKRLVFARLVLVAIAVLIGVNLGETLGRLPTWKDRVSLWTQATQESPWSSLAFANLGQAWIGRGDLDRGLGYLEQAVALNERNVTNRLSLAEGYYELGKVELAIEQVEWVMELDARNSMRYLEMLVEASERLGDERRVEEYQNMMRVVNRGR